MAALGTVMLLIPDRGQGCQGRLVKGCFCESHEIIWELRPYRKDFSCSSHAQQEKCGCAGKWAPSGSDTSCEEWSRLV